VRLPWHRGSSESISTSRTRWAGAGVVAALLVVAGAVILVTRSPTTPPNGHAGATAQPTAALRAHVVSALDASASDILAIHRISSISDGGALNEDVWLSPSLPSPGQPVRRRSLILDASGSPVQDFEVTFTMPADSPVIAGAGVDIDVTGGAALTFRATGSTSDVDYPSRSWSEQNDRSVLVALPGDLATLRTEIQSGGWTAGSVATVDGRPAIELTWHDTVASGRAHKLWIDAGTHLPIKEVYQGGVLGSVESDYRFLPSSTANLAQLAPSAPDGFTNETAAEAYVRLGSAAGVDLGLGAVTGVDSMIARSCTSTGRRSDRTL
jgi:hypothetical protein